jgi:hypothetical protein
MVVDPDRQGLHCFDRLDPDQDLYYREKLDLGSQ